MFHRYCIVNELEILLKLCLYIPRGFLFLNFMDFLEVRSLVRVDHLFQSIALLVDLLCYLLIALPVYDKVTKILSILMIQLYEISYL
jgi:hypothetical protein